MVQVLRTCPLGQVVTSNVSDMSSFEETGVGTFDELGCESGKNEEQG